MTFENIESSSEYIEEQQEDFEKFLASQFPDRLKIYQETDYYNADKEKQEKIDKDIEYMTDLIRSQYTIFSYPHDWKSK